MMMLVNLAFPLVIVAVAVHRLGETGVLDEIISSFFHSCTPHDQMAIMCVIFGIINAAVNLALSLTTSGGGGGGGGGGSTAHSTNKKRIIETPSTNGGRKTKKASSSSTTSPADDTAAAAAADSAAADSAAADSAAAPMIVYPLDEIAKAEKDIDKFKAIFPMLRDELLDHMRETEMPDEAVDWVREMLDYNVPGGKLNRGTTVIAVHRTLCENGKTTTEGGAGGGDGHGHGRVLTDRQVARAAVLGWAIEFLQAFFLVADDVMDESETRRGQPCWYKQSKVQLIAINDSFLLESFVFTLLKRHFGTEPDLYYQLVDLFLDTTQRTEFGQLLDLTSQPMGQDPDKKQPVMDLDRFTWERYRQIVRFKTAYYTFYLPIAMGMITSGVTSMEAYDLARQICCDMGEYFQIQDDYLDCFGAPEVIGKIGTDIQDNKCSWLIVQALQRATSGQRKILLDNYGQWDDGKVANVKQLYRELKLEDAFKEYEEESYRRIQEQLDRLTLMPRGVFELLLKKIYKRSK